MCVHIILYTYMYVYILSVQMYCSWLTLWMHVRCRSVGFTGDASEAVHYACHYLGNLVELEEEGKKLSGRVSDDQVLRPCLRLPDTFELLHHANQVAPMFVLESVVGE